jgi:hypothetical protein
MAGEGGLTMGNQEARWTDFGQVGYEAHAAKAGVEKTWAELTAAERAAFVAAAQATYDEAYGYARTTGAMEEDCEPLQWSRRFMPLSGDGKEGRNG